MELKVVGTGRTADVFEHSPGKVPRRYRKPRDTERDRLHLTCSVPTTGRYRQALTVAGRGLFVKRFLRRYQRSALTAQLPTVETLRRSHRVLPAAIDRMVERRGGA